MTTTGPEEYAEHASGHTKVQQRKTKTSLGCTPGANAERKAGRVCREDGADLHVGGCDQRPGSRQSSIFCLGYNSERVWNRSLNFVCAACVWTSHAKHTQRNALSEPDLIHGR